VCDPTLKDKLNDDESKCIIMNLLIQYYKRYCEEGLEPPHPHRSMCAFDYWFVQLITAIRSIVRSLLCWCVLVCWYRI